MPQAPTFPTSAFLQSQQSGVLYLVVGGQRRAIRDWGSWFALGGPGAMNAVPSSQVVPDAWLASFPVGPDITSPFDPSLGASASSPLISNCSQCGAGQNTGACAGCAPGTPPGYVTTGQGPPISTTSGLPFGFKPTSPVSIVGIRLPAWIWGAGLGAGYLALRGRRRR